LRGPWWDSPPLLTPLKSWSARARTVVGAGGVVMVAVGLLALSVTGLVGFPFGATSTYSGFKFTPGLTILVALLGVLLIRAGAGNAPDTTAREPVGDP
jgi:hypothetical protein